MRTDQFYIYGSNRKPIYLRAERIALYLGAKVIEAVSPNNSLYYLFFYKQNFLTAAKAKKLKRYSFIASAFKQGMVFNAPHPFIDQLLPANHPHRIIRFEPLLKKLNKKYTPQEKAFILTFFESFISKKRLFQDITSIFYNYRRNGQNFLGYRIVRILMDFAPGHDLVKQLAGERSFRDYADLYRRRSEDILPKDQIFAEKVFYAHKETYFQKLITLLDDQSRWMDMMALYADTFIETPSDDYYDHLNQLLTRHFDHDQMIGVLEHLHREVPRYMPLKQDLMKLYMEQHKLKDVLTMYANYDVQLDAAQTASISEMLEQLDLASQSYSPEQLQTLFQMTTDLQPKSAKNLIHHYVTALLKTYEPSFIKELLEPFIEQRAIHPIYLKIDALVKFNDDLDQMQPLGELYYEFDQPDQAIECFSWEMELKPDDPKPLKWLSNVYQELGMKQEADAYRKLFINLQKQA